MEKHNDPAVSNSGSKAVKDSTHFHEFRPTFNNQEPDPSCSSSQKNPFLSPVAGFSGAKDDIEDIGFMNRIQPLATMGEIAESLNNPSNKKTLQKCSTSSESELSDYTDSNSSASNLSPNFRKKKISKKYKYLPSDESDLFSSDENTSSNENSSKFTKKLYKAVIRDILGSGYERIRKKLGKPNYDSVHITPPENIKFDPSVIEESRNPILDKEGRAIINYETTDEFSRFVLFTLPNIPDNDDYENDEAVKKWAASLDQEDDLQEQKHKIDAKSMLESSIMPLKDSELLAETMDDIPQQIGVIYDED